jgi:hypothetical protein
MLACVRIVHLNILQKFRTVQYLSRLVATFPPRKPGFDSVSVLVGFVVDKGPCERFLFRVLPFFLVDIIPPMLHTHLFIYHERYVISVTHCVVK